MIRCTKPIVLSVGVLLCLTFAFLYNVDLGGSDSPFCRNITMFPSYARILGFDNSFTKYADKYSLYLYREQGKDLKPTEENGYSLEGIPVLFIPGNAGSYRQARSIASKSTNLIHEQLQHDPDNEIKFKKLDFFTADFNEDFTAFHGKTMLEQAEYLNEAIKFILNLYSQQQVRTSPSGLLIPIPDSVIVIGHSMGGIVARVLLTLPNYNSHSIKTIITLSSPHYRSPLTFDRDIMKIYRAINEFWSQGFYGNRDVNEFARIAYDRLKDLSIISITGGLLDTVLPADYTTLKELVPYTNGFTVFTSGIPGVWSSIDHLAIVWCDQLRTIILKSLLEIVDYRKSDKLIALPDRMAVFNKYYRPVIDELADYSHTFGNNSRIVELDNEKVQYKSGYFRNIDGRISNIVYSIPEDTKTYFQLLSRSDEILVFLCKDFEKQDTRLSFGCIDVSEKLLMIPQTKGVDSIRDSTIGDKTPPNYALTIDLSHLNEHKYLVVKNSEGIEYVSDLSPESNADAAVSNIVPNRYLLEDFNLMTKVRLVGIRSSILAYRVKFTGLTKALIKQTINEEVKWHINNEFILDYHGDSPYMPMDHDDMELEIWKDSDDSASSKVNLSIELDLLVSMKLMIIRYRLTLVSYGLLVALVVFLFQLQEYAKKVDANGSNMAGSNSLKVSSFEKVMDKMLTLRNILLVFAMSVVIGLLNYFTLFHQIIGILNLEIGNYSTNGLGIKQFQIVNVIFLLISVTLNYGLIYLIKGYLLLVKKLESIKQLQKLQNQYRPKISDKFKLCLLGILFLFTLIVIPYQVIYIVLVVIHIIRLPKLTKASNFSGQLNITMLIIMLWILPINIPIIIVLIHNLTINWRLQFSSHHNLLSIIPIFYQIYYNNGTVLVSNKNGHNNTVYLYWMMGYLGYMINYSFFYGSINTFWLYHLFNYLCIGMILVTYIDQDFDTKLHWSK